MPIVLNKLRDKKYIRFSFDSPSYINDIYNYAFFYSKLTQYKIIYYVLQRGHSLEKKCLLILCKIEVSLVLVFFFFLLKLVLNRLTSQKTRIRYLLTA